ncbi:MAG: hypothetical protein ACD_58C00036G0002 [uncultured bacterium]|nr:MAG: hypothetical protein ACD_58C00036G0002 [uncultured bacterium]
MNEFINNNQNIENQQAQFLSSDEKSMIFMMADLRKKSQELKILVLNLPPPELESLKNKYHETLALVKNEVDGNVVVTKEEAQNYLNEKGEKNRQKAMLMADVAPNLSAYLLADVAKHEQLAELNFGETINYAKKMLDQASGIPKFNPSSMLAEAMILGIQKRETEKMPMPAMEKIASSVASDPDLLKNYALVLDENKREDFINLMPENQRQMASIIMDHELAPFLKEKYINEKDKWQQLLVQDRASRDLGKAVNLQFAVDKPTVKLLCETLKHIESDDSIKLLQKLGFQGLASEKDLEKHLKKISFEARIIKELAEIDSAKGSSLVMKFLGKKEIPARFFRYFCLNLINKNFLTSNLQKFLGDDNHLPFLRKLIAEYPNQFNTVIDTLCDTRLTDYSVLGNQQEIFQALTDLDSLTPIIFDRYRHADHAGKSELSAQIRQLKPKFFQNEPIKNILPAKDEDILVEMVYSAYKPIGMSFEQVKKMIDQLEDKTGDIKNYIFPKEGYPLTITSHKSLRLKENKTTDFNVLNSFKQLFLRENSQESNPKIEWDKLLLGLAKSKTDFNLTELGELLSLISQDDLVTNFILRYSKLDNQNSYNYLMELKEILGVYFKDNYQTALKNYLLGNDILTKEIQELLNTPKRQQAIKKLFGSEKEKIDWQSINTIEGMAKLFGKVLFEKVLKSYREKISQEINKFEKSDIGEKVVTTTSGLKAYFSKNIGSFFAKASAGVCTASDANLFNRNDHLHINIVENEQSVRANIQAYIVKINGQKALLLRGFNPNVDWLDKIDAGAFCESVLEIAKKFQQDNNLAGVYITGQEGSYHALSNREKIANYLKRYLKDAHRVNFSFTITTGTNINSIYQI